MIKRNFAIRAASFLALLTLLLGFAADASAQKKRPAAKPRPKLGTYKKPAPKPAIPLSEVRQCKRQVRRVERVRPRAARPLRREVRLLRAG